MFRIRFWPITARPIRAMSAVCSMLAPYRTVTSKRTAESLPEAGSLSRIYDVNLSYNTPHDGVGWAARVWGRRKRLPHLSRLTRAALPGQAHADLRLAHA